MSYQSVILEARLASVLENYFSRFPAEHINNFLSLRLKYLNFSKVIYFEVELSLK